MECHIWKRKICLPFLLSQLPFVPLSLNSFFFQPCIDHYAVCFDWLVTPSDDTLYLYPPPASPRLDTEQVFEDIQEIYRQSGIQTKKENRLSFTLIFKSGTTVPVVKNLTSVSLFLSFSVSLILTFLFTVVPRCYSGYKRRRRSR